MDTDESLDFIGGTGLEELEPFVEMDEEEAELLQSFEDLVEICLPVVDEPEFGLPLPVLEDSLDEEEL